MDNENLFDVKKDNETKELFESEKDIYKEFTMKNKESKRKKFLEDHPSIAIAMDELGKIRTKEQELVILKNERKNKELREAKKANKQIKVQEQVKEKENPTIFKLNFNQKYF